MNEEEWDLVSEAMRDHALDELYEQLREYVLSLESNIEILQHLVRTSYFKVLPTTDEGNELVDELLNKNRKKL